MATRILARALRTLQGIYRFPGQQLSNESFELGLPIQAVHDVAAHAGEARTWYGNVLVQIDTVAPASIVFDTITEAELRSELLTLGGDAGQAQLDDVPTWLWLLSVSVSSSSGANTENAGVGVKRAAQANPVFSWSTGELARQFETGANSLLIPSLAIPQSMGPWLLTTPQTGASSIVMRAQSGAGGSPLVLYNFFMALAPAGVVPGGR